MRKATTLWSCRGITAILLAGMLVAPAEQALAEPEAWRAEWPSTDFSASTVDLAEFLSGGPPKDGIPAIDRPVFAAPEAVDLAKREAVITVTSQGMARAYPLRVLMWHEIVNDTLGGQPIAVTFCPLCNTGIVFARELDGHTLDFGTTGKLRRSDLVMYDRQTESWWQQFNGEAIVGELAGATLRMLPSRLESYGMFLDRNEGRERQVLVPNDEGDRAYGRNPYTNYDDLSGRPFLYRGELPDQLPPMARVVRVGDRAWSLELLRQKGVIETDGLRLSWQPGQASALDTTEIAGGRDVGNVVVERRTTEGWVDAIYSVDFAFAFHAFFPDKPIHVE